MKISVIMLTYNRELFISRAIESILARTVHDFEFIIVDNDSTGGDGAVADEHTAGDNRIRVIHRKRGSAGSGRNAGLDEARGEYIAFIDDDDWREPDFLEFLYGLATENDADVSIRGATAKMFDDKRVTATEETMIELLWRKRRNVRFPTKLKRGSLFDSAHFSEDAGIIAGTRRVAYHGLPKYTLPPSRRQLRLDDEPQPAELRDVRRVSTRVPFE
jgi:glycosyltransferase involved in cell wall biosynthesis